MAIIVADAPEQPVEADVILSHSDAMMIKRIKDKGLYIDAIKIVRLITKTSISSAKNFVDAL